MRIQLTEAQIKEIGKTGTIIISIDKVTPKPTKITYQDLYNNKELGGFFIGSISGNIDLTYGKVYGDINATNGVAPSESAVERTILEYKLLHLIKANSLEGNNYNIGYDKKKDEMYINISAHLSSSPIQLGGTHIQVEKFIKDYEIELREYFSTHNTKK